jgi:hypothetical protein
MMVFCLLLADKYVTGVAYVMRAKRVKASKGLWPHATRRWRNTIHTLHSTSENEATTATRRNIHVEGCQRSGTCLMVLYNLVKRSTYS